MSDLRPTFRSKIVPYLYRFAKRQFDTEGRHGGSPWPGYMQEPQYATYKRAFTGHGRILRWIPGRERLYPSYTDPDHPENILRINRRSVVFGSAVPYAGTLERPGIGPFGESFPARVVMTFTPSQKRYQNRLVREDIKKRLRRAGVI